MEKSPLNFVLLPQIGVVLLGLLGLVLLLWPGVLLGIFPPLIGLVLILAGAHGVAYALANRQKQAQAGMKLLQSLATLAAGVVFVVKNDVSSAFLAILFGLYVMVMGVLGTVSAVRGGLKGGELAGSVFQSMVFLVWGLMLLLAPFSQLDLWARCLGAYFVFLAVTGLIRLRAVQKELEEKVGGLFTGFGHPAGGDEEKDPGEE